VERLEKKDQTVTSDRDGSRQLVSHRRLHTCGSRRTDSLCGLRSGLVRLSRRPQPVRGPGDRLSRLLPPRGHSKRESNRLSRRRGTHTRTHGRPLGPTRRRHHTGSSEARADRANNTRTCNKLLDVYM
jgi:hypothetical protein